MSPLDTLLKILPPSTETDPWKRTPTLVIGEKATWVVSTFNFLTVGYQGSGAPVLEGVPAKLLLRALNAPIPNAVEVPTEHLKEWLGLPPATFPNFDPTAILTDLVLVVDTLLDRMKLSWLVSRIESERVKLFSTTKHLKIKSLGLEWYLGETKLRATLIGVADTDLKGILTYDAKAPEKSIFDMVMDLE